jgi:hypothetical protein
MTDVANVDSRVLNYDHIEMCEKQLDAYIDRRISSGTDKDVEDLWASSARKFDRNRRVERLYDWVSHHRTMAHAARSNAEAIAREHEREVARIEAQITHAMTGRLENA